MSTFHVWYFYSMLCFRYVVQYQRSWLGLFLLFFRLIWVFSCAFSVKVGSMICIVDSLLINNTQIAFFLLPFITHIVQNTSNSLKIFFPSFNEVEIENDSHCLMLAFWSNWNEISFFLSFSCCYRSLLTSSLSACFKEKLLIRCSTWKKLVELFFLVLRKTWSSMQNNLPSAIDIEIRVILNSGNYLRCFSFHLWKFLKLFNWMSSPQVIGERMRIEVEHNEIVEISSMLESSELMTLIQIHLAIDIRFHSIEGDSCTYFFHFHRSMSLAEHSHQRDFNNFMLPYVSKNLIKIVVDCMWYRILAKYYVAKIEDCRVHAPHISHSTRCFDKVCSVFCKIVECLPMRWNERENIFEHLQRIIPTDWIFCSLNDDRINTCLLEDSTSEYEPIALMHVQKLACSTRQR